MFLKGIVEILLPGRFLLGDVLASLADSGIRSDREDGQLFIPLMVDDDHLNRTGAETAPIVSTCVAAWVFLSLVSG